MAGLFIPVILGTGREGRRTEPAARFVHGLVAPRPDVETVLLDVRDFRMPATDDREETPMVQKYRAIIGRADALVIVTPEYNHGYPGELKMMLDMAYGEYKHKPVAVCATGGGMGGVRMM
ncbi:MAG: NAD(P)H-dependent oxidoreductase, partial [Candidatus Sungbacteria bacterium]|nr:NAD(P)H-dependent oxidoreductase [Candidatus Sungbacteria bacterium]